MTNLFDYYEAFDEWHLCNAVEISGVKQYSDFCEVDNDDPDFFSVYAHYIEGGCQCVADFMFQEDAIAYGEALAELHGYKVNDFTRKETV